MQFVLANGVRKQVVLINETAPNVLIRNDPYQTSSGKAMCRIVSLTVCVFLKRCGGDL